jgi:hypothetical protein
VFTRFPKTKRQWWGGGGDLAGWRTTDTVSGKWVSAWEWSLKDGLVGWVERNIGGEGEDSSWMTCDASSTTERT